MSNTSESKLLADAQATLARATQKEHAGQLDAAYQLYVQAAKELVPLTGKSYRLETRNSAKTFGSRALERANLLKHATQGELRRVQRDPLSEEEQSYILKQSSRVNGITLPIWSSNAAQGQEETRSQVFIDGNGAPQLSPAHNSAAAQWKRPPSELPMVDLDTPDEIVQDVVSDCSVIAALGVCAEHRQRFNSCLAIRAIHPQNEHGVPFRNAQGKYTIRMMFNGTWRMLGLFSPVALVIDELLPTAPDGRLICATTVKQAQLWPALLEKAYMKLMGGYDFPGSNSSIDLHVLTSWIPEHMYLTGDDFQREKSWKRIYDGFVNGKALLTLGTGETVNGEGHWKDILIAAHNYAIVGLEDDGAVQNLKVLNPWRRTDESQGGGLLTISWGLVCNLFESVYLNWDPELFPHSKVIHGMWRERTAESGEHAASNHHYRLRYSSPESVVASQPPEIWVLLTRHVLSKETKADFIALHHFAHGEAGKLPRADQVPNKGTYSDSPHILARIKDAAPNEVISLIAARDGSTPETGYTLSVYSHASVEVEAVTKVLGYIKTANGTFTSKTAGGNASLATFMNNPQYRVRISEPTGRGAGGGRARVPVKLTVEGARTLPLNVKLVWSGGKRVSDVVIGDIVVDSGAYNFGLACVEGEVQAGEYTLVISSFRAGQLGEYAFRVECDMPIEVTQLPPEGAGMFHKPTKGCWDRSTAAGCPSSGNYDSNPAFEITVSSPIQLSARLQMISKPPLSPAPALNLTLFERTAQGSPGKQVATSGAYSDALSGGLDYLVLGLVTVARVPINWWAFLRPPQPPLSSTTIMKQRLSFWFALVIVNVAISCARPHGSRTINDRATYHAYARDTGMCHRRNNPQRTLVVPGPEVVSRFSVCQGRNEFGELVSDTSGSVYCNGTLLHLWNDARDHVGDSKTFVDRASDLSGTQINMALNNMLSENSFTVSEFLEKMEDRFELNQPGQELREYENARFPHTPPVVLGIRPQAKLFRAWTKIVHHYWNNLDRTMVQNCFNGEDDVEAQLLPGPGSPPAHASFDVSGYPAQVKEQCATSIIRLEHPFVIAGGRFREQYYWDSFFVMEGLLAANMTYLARTTLLNFMDEIRSYGFIPNGGRKYYLNRSQPPLFTHMLHAYVHNTNDTAVLHGALPLAEKELRWWAENRSVQVRSPHNSAIVHTVYHYNVEADGPRPESYAEDWRTAWCDTEPPTRSYESAIYSELASGAESGWDYTARWMGDPSTLPDDLIEQMRRVRIRRLVPVDLNSILYRCHVLMAELYQRAVDDDSPYAWQHKRRHERAASLLKTAVLDLHWDETKAGFYDFEMDEARSAVEPRTGRIGTFWSGATFAPFWSGIWPNSVSANQEKAMQAFAGMRDLLRRYEGPLPATVTKSGQQWDFPNAWPPLQYIAIKALQNIPYNLSTADAFKFAKTKTPESQLGVEYDQLPALDGENITGRELDGTTSSSWRNVMLKEMAMRYMTAAFCNWNVTGKLRDDDVETIVKDDPTEDAWLDQFPGAMYEKLNAWDVTRSGHGGEYEIQTGFGWTNGVAIWIAHVLGAKLDNPVCPGLGPGQSFSRSRRGYARPSVLDTSPQPQQPLGA